MRRVIIGALFLLGCAVSLQAHTVDLTWVLSGADSQLYQTVYRQANCSGAYARRAKVSSTAISWTDLNVRNGRTYCYYVTVTVQEGPHIKEVSGPSNIVQVTIPED